MVLFYSCELNTNWSSWVDEGCRRWASYYYLIFIYTQQLIQFQATLLLEDSSKIYNDSFWILQRGSQSLLLKILKTWSVLMLRRWGHNIFDKKNLSTCPFQKLWCIILLLWWELGIGEHMLFSPYCFRFILLINSLIFVA